MKFQRILAAIFCLVPIMGLRAEDPLPFHEGEKLTYRFYWGIFMVGQGSFEVGRDPDDGHFFFHVSGGSNELISTIYPVEEDITSFFDPQKMQSDRFLQNRREGGKHIWEEAFFFHNLGFAWQQSYVAGEKKWFEIPRKRIEDKISTIYYMRYQDWHKRDEYSVVLARDKGNYEVRIKKTGTEVLQTDDFSEIPTFKAEPNTEYLSGFVKKGKLTAWVSDDRFKVPIKVVAKIPIAGTVTARLVEVHGIKDWPYRKKD